MAHTGLEIYKHLPKTNCKDCGLPTCLAFAMKMATKQISLDKCPHVTSQGKAARRNPRPDRPSNSWSSARATPRSRSATRRNSTDTRRSSIDPPAVAVRVSDTLRRRRLGSPRVEAIGKLAFERVGARIAVNLVAVDNVSRDAVRFETSRPGWRAEKSGSGLCADVGRRSVSAASRGGSLSVGPAAAVVHLRSCPGRGRRGVAKDENCPLAIRGRRTRYPVGTDQ